jgi:hypothetical protein
MCCGRAAKHLRWIRVGPAIARGPGRFAAYCRRIRGLSGDSSPHAVDSDVKATHPQNLPGAAL